MEFPSQEYWRGLPLPSPGDRTCVPCVSRQTLPLSHPEAPYCLRDTAIFLFVHTVFLIPRSTYDMPVTIPNRHNNQGKKKRSPQFLMLLGGVTSLALSSFPASSLACSSTDLAFQLHRLGISDTQDNWLFLNVVCYLKTSFWACVCAFPLSIAPPFRASPS